MDSIPFTALLGVGLQDPDARAELWLALRLTGRG